jgi:hypothetical protein
MIKEIQVAEAQAWKELKRSQHVWGSEDDLTNKLRGQWRVIYELRKAVGVKGLPVAELIALDLVPQIG